MPTSSCNAINISHYRVKPLFFVKACHSGTRMGRGCCSIRPSFAPDGLQTSAYRPNTALPSPSFVQFRNLFQLPNPPLLAQVLLDFFPLPLRGRGLGDSVSIRRLSYQSCSLLVTRLVAGRLPLATAAATASSIFDPLDRRLALPTVGKIRKTRHTLPARRRGHDVVCVFVVGTTASESLLFAHGCVIHGIVVQAWVELAR